MDLKEIKCIYCADKKRKQDFSISISKMANGTYYLSIRCSNCSLLYGNAYIKVLKTPSLAITEDLIVRIVNKCLEKWKDNAFQVLEISF